MVASKQKVKMAEAIVQRVLETKKRRDLRYTLEYIDGTVFL